jgi:multidrug resistance efflux pump
MPTLTVQDSPQVSENEPPSHEQVDSGRLSESTTRHSPHVLLLLGLSLLGLTTALGVWLWQTQPWAPASAGFRASGTLEADEVLVGSEVAGRIVALVDEGESVRAGDALARLDDSLLQIQLRQAEVGQRQQLEVTADRYVIRSPADGVVTRVPLHLGEVVSPGQTIVAVANLARLKLTAYVLERDLGPIQVGQRVAVTADPFPDQVFAATVTSTNPRAEFTPRNVQTQRDRLNLVFGVKLLVDNPAGLLKPGMPADVSFSY